MSTTTEARFEQLLSARAAIGRPVRGGGAGWPGSAQYEFGGGKPDPASFPYDELVDATRRMMVAEGAQALTYGEPMGYRGLREVLADKFSHFEGLEASPGSGKSTTHEEGEEHPRQAEVADQGALAAHRTEERLGQCGEG